MNLLFDTYLVKIALVKEMLGTNPLDPNVMDNHIIDRQRKLISEKSEINKAINKYYKALEISDERKDLELGGLRKTIEELWGKEFSDNEFNELVETGFKKLKETMSELDDKGTTCFFRNPETGEVCIGSHMILGFLKASGESIAKTLPKKNGTVLQSATYTNGIINQHVKITPDLIDASNDIVRDSWNNPVYLQRSLRAMTAQGPRISLAKSEQLPKDTTFQFEINVLKNSPLTEEHITTMLSYGQIKGLGQWRNAGHGSFEVVEFGRK